MSRGGAALALVSGGVSDLIVISPSAHHRGSGLVSGNVCSLAFMGQELRMLPKHGRDKNEEVNGEGERIIHVSTCSCSH